MLLTPFHAKIRRLKMHDLDAGAKISIFSQTSSEA
jgi:hypothetical protein